VNGSGSSLGRPPTPDDRRRDLGDLGPVAPDGSPVEFYRLFPETGEAAIIHDALPPGCRVLELGCGVGRITHRLIEFGHQVVAVNNSPEMLAHVRGAETVLSDIERLDHIDLKLVSRLEFGSGAVAMRYEPRR
jgi:SAM-dependent methyltransferase